MGWVETQECTGLGGDRMGALTRGTTQLEGCDKGVCRTLQEPRVGAADWVGRIVWVR